MFLLFIQMIVCFNLTSVIHIYIQIQVGDQVFLDICWSGITNETQIVFCVWKWWKCFNRCSHTSINYLAFQSFYLWHTGWRLFQKLTVWTKLYIYVRWKQIIQQLHPKFQGNGHDAIWLQLMVNNSYLLLTNVVQLYPFR
jgi:hypothetical protein